MGIFDIILLIILGGFTLFGFSLGFIQALGGLVGLLLGVYCSAHWYDTVGNWLSYIFWGNENLSKIIAFILIYVVVSRLVQFVFYLINKIFKIVSIVPFLKTINRLLGAVLGFLEGLLFIGVVLYFLTRYPIADWLNQAITESVLVSKFLFTANILLPLLPGALKQIQAIL